MDKRWKVSNPTEDVTHVEVHCGYYESHNKARQGVYVYVQTWKFDDDGGGMFASWQCVPTAGERMLYQQMDRRNVKKQKQYREEVFQSLRDQRGQVWDFVHDYCVKRGLEVNFADKDVFAAA